jgi:hypothetical protein
MESKPEYISQECVALEATLAVARRLAEALGAPEGLVAHVKDGAPLAVPGGDAAVLRRAERAWAVLVQKAAGAGDAWELRVRASF